MYDEKLGVWEMKVEIRNKIGYDEKRREREIMNDIK
jgi:hypothetical protein